MTKVSMKERIAEVLGGLVLLLAGYMLLTLINPNLVVLDQKLANVEYVNYGDIENFEGVVLDPYYPGEETVSNDILLEYVYVSRDASASSTEAFESLKECREATGDECRREQNTDYTNAGQNAVPITGDILVLARGSSGYNKMLTKENIEQDPELEGWPENPYRRPSDFVDCLASPGVPKPSSSGVVRMSKSVIALDAYFNRQLQEAGYMSSGGNFKPLAINSAYRNNPGANGPCITTGKGTNHPYSYSLDYGLNGMPQAGILMFEQLVLGSDVCRLGLGPGYAHVQWNAVNGAPCAPSGNASGSRIFWCYGGQRGFYSGKTPPGWAGSC